MIKHQTTCSECNHVFWLEDSKDCKHQKQLGIGSKECPNCNQCICHADTYDGIKKRFQDNIISGKFVPAGSDTVFKWVCRSAKRVHFGDNK